MFLYVRMSCMSGRMLWLKGQSAKEPSLVR